MSVRGAWVTVLLRCITRGLLGVGGIVVGESGLEVGEAAERFKRQHHFGTRSNGARVETGGRVVRALA